MRSAIKKYLLPGLLCITIVSCGAWPAVSVTPVPATTTAPTGPPLPRDTDDDRSTPLDSENTACPADRVCLRWLLDQIGTDASQLVVEQAVVDEFNAAQAEIWLSLEVFPNETPLSPRPLDRGLDADIIGPLTRWNANKFPGEWVDLKAHLAAHPELITGLNPALLASYEAAAGEIGLPVTAYPAAIFYNTVLFDKAGLEYPASDYGPQLGPATYHLDSRSVEWNWDTVREVARRLTLDADGRNATQAGFDRSRVVQYGFAWDWLNQPAYIGSFWGNGSYLAADGRSAQVPEAWQEAWKWTYAGIWDSQPWIPDGPASLSLTADIDIRDYSSAFLSGKVGMIVQQSWYMCCLEKMKTWDLGVLPAYHGKVSGRIDTDFFAVWKGSKYPDQAFRVLAYLLGPGREKLSSAYGATAVPLRAQEQPAWLAARRAQFPSVKHWQVFITNLNFPDSPSADAWMPNYGEARQRGEAFYKRLAETDGLGIQTEISLFQADLQAIFDRAP